ncbi:TPA: EAL domain-containing protein [Klebsiella oxytoca]
MKNNFNDLSIESGIERKEFYIIYQPIFDENHNIVGAEALARWLKDGKQISPEVFIAAAEDKGLIDILSQTLLEIIIDDFKGFPQDYFFYLSLNVSVKLFLNSCSYHYFCQLRKKINLNIELILEITEHQQFVGNDEIITNLMSIKNEGFLLALDDFGTGFNNLECLLALNLDYLKIDKKFISEENDSNGFVCVKSIKILAEEFGLDIIAEGVETVKQHEKLLGMGIILQQGFFLSPGIEIQSLIDKISINK